MSDNWTIMVYMSADDVLANFAIDSLNQLRRATLDDGNIVVVLFDPNDGTGNAAYFRFDGTNKDVPLTQAGPTMLKNVDMADPNTLTEFINEASAPYDPNESRHYCLILWGHGTELLLDQDPAPEEHRYLTPAKLKQALERSRFKEKNKKIDIIAFDACSMSMVELASTLQDYVKFMIASQEEVPDVSFPYQRILEGLKTHVKPVRADTAG